MRSAALELDLDVAAHRRGWHLQIFHWKTGPRECARGGRPAEGTDQTVNQDSPIAAIASRRGRVVAALRNLRTCSKNVIATTNPNSHLPHDAVESVLGE